MKKLKGVGNTDVLYRLEIKFHTNVFHARRFVETNGKKSYFSCLFNEMITMKSKTNNNATGRPILR